MKNFNTDLISVIVPVYNVEPYLPKCIESIMSQTYSNLEIILVDDGSPDNCPKICDEYAKKDSRIIVIHKNNGGLSEARNAGIDASSGDWIAFVDSDDYIAPNMVESLHEAADKQNADMAICSVDLFSDDTGGVKIHETRTVTADISSGYDILKTTKLGEFNYVISWNKIYRRSLWQKLRYPPGRIHEDAFVAHHLFGMCEKVVCIPASLCYYRQTSGSITNAPYSIKRLDDFDALADRAQYYLDNGLCEYIGSVLTYYYERLRVKYYLLEDNADTHVRLKECRKTARRYIRYFVTDRNILLTVRIVTLVFLYFPKLYRFIFRK